jgi:hypothetical protein
MSERFAIRTAQFRTAALVVCLVSACAFAQTADTGATPPTSNPTPTYTPLTGGERLHNYLYSLYAPMSFFTGATSAGIGQWRDSPHEWGQGGAGYGRRFASGYAQRFVRETLMYGSSSLLREDNRYFRSMSNTNGGRLRHAVFAIFLARKDDGSTTFSYSRMGSMLSASFISRAWQPPSTSGVSDAFSNFGVSVGANAGFNVVREFMPKKFPFHKK